MGDLKEALEKAIDALERDMPRDVNAVVLRTGDGGESQLYVCGRCNQYLGANWDYCPFCGQRIKI